MRSVRNWTSEVLTDGFIGRLCKLCIVGATKLLEVSKEWTSEVSTDGFIGRLCKLCRVQSHTAA